MFAWFTNLRTAKTIKVIVSSEGVGETISNETSDVLSLNSMIGETRQKIVQFASKGKYTLVAQSVDIWTGTNKRQVSIELKFIANTDAYKEVFLPVRMFQRWASPSRSDVSKEIVINKRNVGYWNMMPPVEIKLIVAEEYKSPLIRIEKGLITTCEPKWEAPFDKHGYPIVGELQLTINDLDPLVGQKSYPEGADEENHIEAVTEWSVTNKNKNYTRTGVYQKYSSFLRSMSGKLIKENPIIVYRR